MKLFFLGHVAGYTFLVFSRRWLNVLALVWLALC